MKRIIASVLFALSLMAYAGCGGASGPAEAPEDDGSVAPTAPVSSDSGATPASSEDGGTVTPPPIGPAPP